VKAEGRRDSKIERDVKAGTFTKDLAECPLGVILLAVSGSSGLMAISLNVYSLSLLPLRILAMMAVRVESCRTHHRYPASLSTTADGKSNYSHLGVLSDCQPHFAANKTQV
jgi:hypothetical protein